MLIDLIDALRCPADHPESALVAALDRVEDRDVIHGMLGCPVCRSEFQIREGALWMVTAAMPAPRTRARNPDDGLRLAASLDLRSESGFAILRGSWCALALPMLEVSPTHLVLLDPPFGTPEGVGRSVVHAGGTVPFINRSSLAVAIDDPERAFALSETVKTGGRVVAPIDIAIPRGVREVVRDDRWWVGEKEAELRTVEMVRRSRPGK